MSIVRDLKTSLKGVYGALIRLITINVIVFLTLNIILSIFVLSGSQPDFAGADIADWTDLPSNFHHFPSRCWTILTYMFVHYSLAHIFSNMLIFYFLGRIFSDMLGGARLTGVYIIGGIIGGLVYMLLTNLIFSGQHQTRLEGASAGVMAVVVAIAAYAPDHIVFFFRWSVKLKWVALIAFILTTLLDLSDNAGGKFSHIGGAAFGLLYGGQLRSGKKFLEGFMRLFSFKRNHLRVEHSRSKIADDYVYNERKISVRKQVDEILDKISRSGYDSLSREEKDFLQKNHDKL